MAEHNWYELRINPVWEEIGKNWDKLVDLYEKEKYKEVYELLSELRENARKEQKD